MYRFLSLLMFASLACGDLFAEELVDPTVPPGTKVEVPARQHKTPPPPVRVHRLTFTRLSSGGDLAIIDGRPYRVGEPIGRTRVRSIRSGEVDLADGRTLRVMRPGIKSVRQDGQGAIARQ